MSKKQTHGPVPSGNQPKHGFNWRKPAPEDDEQPLVESTETQRSATLDDVADEKGRIHPVRLNNEEIDGFRTVAD